MEVEIGNGNLVREDALILADGFIKGVERSQTLMLRIGMVLVPLVAMIAAYAIIRSKYKIDEKEYKRLVEEIAKSDKK